MSLCTLVTLPKTATRPTSPTLAPRQLQAPLMGSPRHRRTALPPGAQASRWTLGIAMVGDKASPDRRTSVPSRLGWAPPASARPPQSPLRGGKGNLLLARRRSCLSPQGNQKQSRLCRERSWDEGSVQMEPLITAWKPRAISSTLSERRAAGPGWLLQGVRRGEGSWSQALHGSLKAPQRLAR